MTSVPLDRPVADGDVFGMLDSVAALLARLPGPPVLDGRQTGGGLPARPIGLGELAGLLPTLVPCDRDRVWARVVRRARAGDPAWRVAAAHLALPGLRRVVARLAGGCAAVDVHEVQGEALTGFLTALKQVDTRRPAIGHRLIWAAYRAGAAFLATEARHLAHRAELRDGDGAAARGPVTHPDLLLADAVAQHVLTAADAELIGRTRIENRSLTVVAGELGLPYATACHRRRRAEQALVEAIGAEEIDAATGPHALLNPSLRPAMSSEEPLMRGHSGPARTGGAHATAPGGA